MPTGIARSDNLDGDGISYDPVIAGLDPAIHSIGFTALRRNGMDARVKPGQDE
jgi:hypothetical protein